MARAAGSRLIANMAKDMAEARGLPLEEISWLPDAALEGPEESSRTYALVLVFAFTLVQEAFSRETLQRVTQDRAEKERVRTLLGKLLDRLVSTPP